MYFIQHNQQINNFTVLSKVNGKKKKTWKCKCICGNEVEVTEESLVSGNVTSCGCKDIPKRYYKPALKYTIDEDSLDVDIFPGKKFNKLTVLERSKRNFIKCLCECGKEIEVDEAFLLNNIVKSCGCDK